MFLIISGRYLNLGNIKVLKKIPKCWQKNELDEWENGESIAKRLIFNLECENKSTEIKFDFINYEKSVIFGEKLAHYWKCNLEGTSVIFENPKKYGIKLNIEKIELQHELEDNFSELELCQLINKKINEKKLIPKMKQIAIDIEYINKTGKVNLSKSKNSFIWDKSTGNRVDDFSNSAFKNANVDYENLELTEKEIKKYETTADFNQRQYANINKSIVYYRRGKTGVCRSGSIVIYDGFKNIIAKRIGFKYNKKIDKKEFCNTINKKMYELAEKYNVPTKNFGLSIAGENFVNSSY